MAALLHQQTQSSEERAVGASGGCCLCLCLCCSQPHDEYGHTSHPIARTQAQCILCSVPATLRHDNLSISVAFHMALRMQGVDLRTSVTWLRQLAAAPCARLSELGQPLGPHAVAILRARELSAARSNLARCGTQARMA